MRSTAIIALALVAASAGCRQVEPTEILVEVQSDLGSAVDYVDIRVYRVLSVAPDDDGGPLVDAQSAVDGGVDAAGDAAGSDAATADAGRVGDAGSADSGSDGGVRVGSDGGGTVICVPANDAPVTAAGYNLDHRRCVRTQLGSGGDGRGFPVTLGVLPSDPSGNETLAVEAIAYGATGEIVRQVAHTRFELAHIVHLVLSLSADCRGITCPQRETCRLARCVSVELPSACTPGTDAGNPMACALDGSVASDGSSPSRDGGPDAAGPNDAGSDSSPSGDGGPDAAGPNDAGSDAVTCACSAGTQQYCGSGAACGNCGHYDRVQVCADGCNWGTCQSTGTCGHEGACSPGDRTTTGTCCPGTLCQAPRTSTCDGSCRWLADGCGRCTRPC